MSSSESFGQATVEPELQGRTPRRVRYTRDTWNARLFYSLFCLGVLGLIAAFAAHDLGQLRALQAHGEQSQGSIVLHHSSYYKNANYYLDYLFPADMDMISDTEEVSLHEYVYTEDGDHLTITYLPANPNIHRVGVVDDRYLRHSLGLWSRAFGITALVLGLLVFLTERYLYGTRRLLANGVAVKARVTDRKMVQNGKSYSYYVSYEFDGPHGPVSRKIGVSRADFDRNVPGTTMTILYDPVRPDRNRFYSDFNAVRVA